MSGTSDVEPYVTICNLSKNPGYIDITTEVKIDGQPYVAKEEYDTKNLLARTQLIFIGFAPVRIGPNNLFRSLLEDPKNKNKEISVTLKIHITPISKRDEIYLEYDKTYEYRNGQWENSSLGAPEDYMDEYFKRL